jgi:aminomethyltransferase
VYHAEALFLQEFSVSATDQPNALLRTPLYDLHVELGARLVPFAGYEMPVQYRDGILKEHLHTRAQAGLFDVSHMGQIRLRGADAAKALEALVPVDIVDLPANRQRYALFTGAQGGILDDLMVSNAGDHLLLVVNAACKQADLAHLKAALPDSVEIEYLQQQALLALQGPAARAVLARLAPAAAELRFMHAASIAVDDIDCWVSCSGYTGEDGFEISVPAAQAERLARRLLAEPEVAAIGLGARDSLRLEAGLCLYGHDIDTATTPVEAGLVWALSKARRPGGARAGGYPGAEVIERQLAEGADRQRVLLKPEGRQPVREGSVIVSGEREVGVVTSGGFGPSLGAPVAMGYVRREALEQPLQALVRGKPVPLSLQRGPFAPHRYCRG